jgi:hypothetical protein
MANSLTSPPSTAELNAATPADRDRYADLLRLFSIGMDVVVLLASHRVLPGAKRVVAGRRAAAGGRYSTVVPGGGGLVDGLVTEQGLPGTVVVPLVLVAAGALVLRRTD